MVKTALAVTLLAGAPPMQRKHIEYPGQLTVEFHHQLSKPAEQLVVFDGGVKAIFGPTTLECDQLTLHLDPTKSYGEAVGHVTLNDPIGQATGDRLQFNWKDKTGILTNANMHGGNLKVSAQTVYISPSHWDFIGTSGTNCSLKRPVYQINAESARVYPGRRADLHGVSLKIFGEQVLKVPKTSFSLDPRETGFNPPSFTTRQGSGLGITWANTFLINPHTSIFSAFNLFKREYPTYGLVVTDSLLKGKAGRLAITPRSDLDERQGGNYFEDVSVKGPRDSNRVMFDTRNSVSAGFTYNRNAADRDPGHTYSKALDVDYEFGHTILGLGTNFQFRAHSVRRDRGSFKNQGQAFVSIATKPMDLIPYTSLIARGDVAGYVGESTSGWAQGQAGVFAEPVNFLRFSGAYTVGVQSGTAQFPIDALERSHYFALRGDLDFGETHFSLIHKFDTDSRQWYDREYMITQGIGCVELFVRYRKQPSDYRIGLTLKFDNFLQSLQDREIKRP
ncbi:MAG: hypothetical protein JSS72_06165 [Armatimonadetes bacterium]|nr:hypothetical protein [Armatimonadota bacterium]